MSDTKSEPSKVQVINAPPRRQAPPPGPCAMVIFGASGDLTRRLLVPALYNLARTGLIPEHFAIIGVDITERSAEDWRNSLHEMLQSFVGNPSSENRIDAIDDAAWQRLTGGVSYVQGDFGDSGLFEKLKQHLADVARDRQTGGNCLFYLAVADRFFGPIVEQLGHAGLLDEELQDGKPQRWRRVVIEKPFGHSVDSAHELNTRIRRDLREEQIYRIDHFLGKETVQNIMAFRFANGLFEPIWNRDRIDHVQITVAETVGVEHRGRFYEVTGALRDMVPNHVFQLAGDGGDGTARGVRCALGPRSQGRRDRRAGHAEAGGRGAWPVRSGNGAADRGPWLPCGAERGGRFQHRDLRRHAARDRQLALGGRAVLPAHRQAHVAPL